VLCQLLKRTGTLLGTSAPAAYIHTGGKTSGAHARCAGRQAYQLRFDRIAQSTTRFQCVFVLVHPDEEVQSAAAAARRAFGLGDGEGYTPHLSLLYADIPQEERAELVEQLQARARARLLPRHDHRAPSGGPAASRAPRALSCLPLNSVQVQACPAAWDPDSEARVRVERRAQGAVPRRRRCRWRRNACAAERELHLQARAGLGRRSRGAARRRRCCRWRRTARPRC